MVVRGSPRQNLFSRRERERERERERDRERERPDLDGRKTTRSLSHESGCALLDAAAAAAGVAAFACGFRAR
jgi:hypothetical protein